METTRSYPRLHLDTALVPAVGQAGGVLLTETIRATGLDQRLSEALSPWRKPFAVHDPGKIITDLALSLALGGDALSDASVLRDKSGVYGPVASEATISRLISLLAKDADRAITAINTTRQAARTAAWELADPDAPGAAASAAAPLTIDLDATLITAYSEKENASPTFKRGYGFYPLCAFADHGPAGSGEMLAIRLRPGNSGSNTAADHIQVTSDALAQLPGRRGRPGKSVLIRADGAGGTKAFTGWLARRRLSYSVGYTLPAETPDLYRLIPEHVWDAAYTADGEPRDGAGVG